MSLQSPRILVVGHDLHPGATSVLLDVCRVLERRGYELKFVFYKDGPFLKSFNELGETILFDPQRRATGVRSAWHRRRAERVIRRWLASWATVVYSNCVVTTVPLLRWLGASSVPVIVHAHELGSILRLFDFARHELVTIPRHYVAASTAVRTVLEDLFAIERTRTTVAYEGIDLDRVDDLAAAPAEIALEGGFVVGGCGRADFGKGIDLWIRVAHAVATHAPAADIRFVWCGAKGAAGDRFYELVKRDIRQLNLDDRVTFPGYVRNQYPIFRQFDVLALTSREDACPLVSLENLYLGNPVVCFQDSGGAPEIIGDDAGASVPYLDVDAMARAILSLYEDPNTAARFGETGRERVRQLCSVETLADTLIDVFDRCGGETFAGRPARAADRVARIPTA